ncbi:MAG: DegT/DnrJ/EryC1/StrS family aminotransferase [Candidatus Omnitrophica bacterium]|nr:DegT/DnrJ/EryC1/StrS family aminotransferase [Candidatus Omnitrophota bacterium]
MSVPFVKIPRARLYLPTFGLLRALALLPFSRLGRGEKTGRAEAELAAHCGFRHAQTVSSCRLAFHLVLKVLKLREGDEVLMTPLTIPDMVNAIHTLGLKPVFVDLSPEAQNIDLEDLKRKITPRSRVLLVTHLAGLVPQDLKAIAEEARRAGLALVEDISQNWDARAGGQLLGTLGAAAVGSFSIGKTLASLAGGVVLTNDDRMAAEIRSLAQGLLTRPDKGFLLGQILANLKFNLATHRTVFSLLTYHAVLAVCRGKPAMINALQEAKRDPRKGAAEILPFEANPRILRSEMPPAAFTYLCDLQSDLLLRVLKRSRALTDERRRLAHHLTARLSRQARRWVPSSVDEGANRNVYWHYPLVVPEEPGQFQMFLLLAGIDNGGYALALCSEEPAFAAYAASTPGARRIKQNTVFLPIHNSFSLRQMEYIAEVVNRYFELHPSPAPGAHPVDSRHEKTSVPA